MITKQQIELAKAGQQVPLQVDGVELAPVRKDLLQHLNPMTESEDFDPREAYPAILRAWDQDDSPEDYEFLNPNCNYNIPQ